LLPNGRSWKGDAEIGEGKKEGKKAKVFRIDGGGKKKKNIIALISPGGKKGEEKAELIHARRGGPEGLAGKKGKTGRSRKKKERQKPAITQA